MAQSPRRVLSDDSRCVDRIEPDRRYAFGWWSVHISVMASDLDSPDQLLHSFDFDSDFVFERPSRLSGSAFYQYAQPGRYQVNVLLTDPWSGQQRPMVLP